MDAELLRGLAGLREAIKDWGDNMRSETMADLLAHVDRIELSVAQGQGFGEPVAWMVEVTGVSGAVYRSVYTTPINPEWLREHEVLRPLYALPAAPAQPDGVE